MEASNVVLPWVGPSCGPLRSSGLGSDGDLQSHRPYCELWFGYQTGAQPYYFLVEVSAAETAEPARPPRPRPRRKGQKGQCQEIFAASGLAARFIDGDGGRKVGVSGAGFCGEGKAHKKRKRSTMQDGICLELKILLWDFSTIGYFSLYVLHPSPASVRRFWGLPGLRQKVGWPFPVRVLRSSTPKKHHWTFQRTYHQHGCLPQAEVPLCKPCHSLSVCTQDDTRETYC